MAMTIECYKQSVPKAMVLTLLFHDTVIDKWCFCFVSDIYLAYLTDFTIFSL